MTHKVLRRLVNTARFYVFPGHRRAAAGSRNFTAEPRREHSAAASQPNLGNIPAKTQRSQRSESTRKIIPRVFIFPFDLGDCALARGISDFERFSASDSFAQATTNSE